MQATQNLLRNKQMEYTLSGLPKLTKDVARVLKRDIARRAGVEKDFNFNRGFYKRQIKEDPNLDYFVDFFIQFFRDESYHMPMLGGVTDMYELLRRQSETGVLEGIKKPNTTPSGLYFLQEEVIVAFIRDLARRSDEGEEARILFQESMLDTIRKEDRNVSLLLRTTRRFGGRTNEESRRITIGAQWTYELMRRQAETRMLEEFQ